MAIKDRNDDIEVLFVKIILSILMIVLWLIFVIFAPKTVFSRNMSHHLAISMAIISEENLLIYDYDVYINEERFTTGLIRDVDEVNQSFLKRNEVLAVKIYGSEESVEFKENYILITSPDALELNIEYYLVKDMEFNDINLPIRTFIMLFNDVSKIVNTVYLAIFLIVSISIITPISIKLTRNIIRLNKVKKTVETV